MRRGAGALVALAACVLAAPATASTPILLPSVRTTLTPGPPLISGATGAETVYPPGMTSDENVNVGVDASGTPVSVVAVQRLRLSKLGDYSFVVPGPITDVQAAPGSGSEPGLRRGAIIWAGFSPGHRTLAARATLDARRVVQLLPLRLSLARIGNTLTVHGENTSAASAPLLVGEMPVAQATTALRQTLRTLPLGIAAPDVYANVTGTPFSRAVRIAAPLDVTGAVGDARFHYVLGDGRPMTFTRQIANVPAGAKLRVVAKPVPPLRLLRGRPRDSGSALSYVARARLMVARELQYQTFLTNPNPTGRSTAAYVYEIAKRTAAPVPAATEDDTHSTWPTILIAALAVVGAGGLVVLWAHS
jgi:hypothetical protein